MNKKAKIGLAAGGVCLILLVALYLKKESDRKAGPGNSIQHIEQTIADQTYKTKTEAYEAYANEKESFYNRPATIFGKSLQTATGATKEEKAVPETNPIKNEASDAQFDEAYQQIERNLHSIYEGNEEYAPRPGGRATQATPQTETPQVIESAEDRRRRAMMQGWGMTNTTTANEQDAQTTTPAFRAVIHGTQLIKSGQTALFRTKESIQYGIVTVPANTLLSGFASTSENRLTIRISSVRLGHEVYTLPLEVYGSDGIPGIPLNYDEVGKIANSETSSTALRETSSALSRYGGTVGRVAGSLTSGMGNQVRTTKNVEIKLIDNQTIILKIVEQ